MIKSRKNQVLREDFEKYRIHLPFSVILKGKVNKYIYSELEKRHPCFTNDCYFNSKFKFDGKGIDSDVLVMNKLKLSEYLGNNFLKLKLMSFEGLKEKRLLSVDLDKKKILCLFFGFLLFFLLVIYLLFGNLKGTNKEKKIEKSAGLLVLDDSESYEIIENLRERKKSVNNFFNEMIKAGAKIEVLKWKSDSFKEYAWISAYGVHPQSLKNVDFGENVKDFNSVEYKNNKPYFSLKIEDFIENKQVKSEKNPGERSHSAEELKEIQSVIRNTLNSYNLQLLSEKMQPYSISFTCKEYKEIDKTNFLMAINELSEKWNIKISELVLESAVEESSGNSFFGQITFDFNENFNSGINLNPLAIRPSLILYKNKVAAQRPVNNQNNFVQNKSKNNKEKILGQITHADGSVIIYYKNSEGKVLWEKKKAY